MRNLYSLNETEQPANAPLLRRLREWSGGLLRLIYPPTCPGCRSSLLSESEFLCGHCRDQIHPPDSVPIMAELARLPGYARVVDDAFALWRIESDGPARRVHHLLKYGSPSYGRILGREIADAMRESGLMPLPGDIIIPVPLHRTRFFERGYNQSATLAAGIADSVGAECRTDLLLRRRATRSQTRLTRSERWNNVSGAFDVRSSEIIVGRHVFLVDDVLTTGATIASAASALRSHGAACITTVTLGFAQN